MPLASWRVTVTTGKLLGGTPAHKVMLSGWLNVPMGTRTPFGFKPSLVEAPVGQSREPRGVQGYPPPSGGLGQGCFPARTGAQTGAGQRSPELERCRPAPARGDNKGNNDSGRRHEGAQAGDLPIGGGEPDVELQGAPHQQ